MKGEPRLARATSSGQGEQPTRGQERHRGRELTLSPDEARHLARKVVRRRVEAAQRWVVVTQAIDEQLIDPLRMDEVFEAMLPEVAEGEAPSEAIAHQRLGRLGHEDLPTMTRGRDARGAV